MKTKVSRTTGDKPAFAWFVGTIAMATVILATLNARASLIIDDFDSYSNGALLGNGGWTNTPPGFTTTGINVANSDNPISSPKVAQFDDNTSSSLGIRYSSSLGGKGVISFYARHLTNNLSDTSGFQLRLNSDVGNGIISPDPFFIVGFNGGSPSISWFTYGGGADGGTGGIVTTGTWFKFYMDYDITHTTLGNTNRVQLQITDMSSSTVVVNQSLTFPNQNGGRTFLGSFDFVTGSVNQHSVFELDNVSVPEPSSVAMAVAAGGFIWLRSRRRQS